MNPAIPAVILLAFSVVCLLPCVCAEPSEPTEDWEPVLVSAEDGKSLYMTEVDGRPLYYYLLTTEDGNRIVKVVAFATATLDIRVAE